MKAFTIIGVLVALSHGLAFADVKSGEAKSFFCDLCHNTGFHDGTAPLLQGQPAPYLVLQLQAFKDKRRVGGDMTTNVSSMSTEDMRDIADYFAAQKPPRTPFRPDPAKVTLGRQKANELGCASCHRSDYSGQGDVPRLAGQWYDYLGAQLKDFRSGKRAHGDAASTDTVRNPTVDDADILVHFLTAQE
jgi:cytochrome c553